MTSSSPKQQIKKALGSLPLTAEIDWLIRHRGKPTGKFNLEYLKKVLPDWRAEVEASPYKNRSGKKVFLFGIQRPWIRHTILFGLGLAGFGHELTLGYLPFSHFDEPYSNYDIRRFNMYAKEVLKQAEPTIQTISLLDINSQVELPSELEQAVTKLSEYDVQYIQQKEHVDISDALFALRFGRNSLAASAALAWMQENNPDVVIVPNGLIFEFGAIFQVARYLEIPVVSYEFGEQQERAWLSQNREVIHQDTTVLWEAVKEQPFGDAQIEKLEMLINSRQDASLWKNFQRRWQGQPSEGAEKVRAKLGLDERPVVLLAANVVGDSLTLGRQIFTSSMTDWILRTVEYFVDKNQAQFVLRVHPGEAVMDGPSVAEIVREKIPNLPKHIHIIEAEELINTYDLISIASLGLTYTTTVGLEMAMRGLPVIPVGDTHYRGKGFTLDLDSWEQYFETLDEVLDQPDKFRLSDEQTRTVWHYAYRFFFDYPFPFPWHIRGLRDWSVVEIWPLRRVFSPEGERAFGRTFRYFVGEQVEYGEIAPQEKRSTGVKYEVE